MQHAKKQIKVANDVQKLFQCFQVFIWLELYAKFLMEGTCIESSIYLKRIYIEVHV